MGVRVVVAGVVNQSLVKDAAVSAAVDDVGSDVLELGIFLSSRGLFGVLKDANGGLVVDLFGLQVLDSQDWFGRASSVGVQAVGSGGRLLEPDGDAGAPVALLGWEPLAALVVSGAGSVRAAGIEPPIGGEELDAHVVRSQWHQDGSLVQGDFDAVLISVLAPFRDCLTRKPVTVTSVLGLSVQVPNERSVFWVVRFDFCQLSVSVTPSAAKGGVESGVEVGV